MSGFWQVCIVSWSKVWCSKSTWCCGIPCKSHTFTKTALCTVVAGMSVCSCPCCLGISRKWNFAEDQFWIKNWLKKRGGEERGGKKREKKREKERRGERRREEVRKEGVKREKERRGKWEEGGRGEETFSFTSLSTTLALFLYSVSTSVKLMLTVL